MSESVRLGVNYWPSYAGPAMWRDFQGDEITLDLQALKAAEIEYLRAFLFWPDFMPTPTRVEPEMLARLRAFLQLCHKAGLEVHLTFIVGHMSGQNWSPPWLKDPRRLFDDPELLEVQECYLTQVVKAVRGHPALSGYVLSNEMPLFTGSAPPEAVAGWASRLYHCLKRLEPNLPVGLGDGAWYTLGTARENEGADSGFRAGCAQDVIAPHLYLADTHPERQRAAYGLALALAKRLADDYGREMWLEEFGATHSVFGEAEIAEWASHVAREAQLHGVTRLCWWCGLDFRSELAAQEPYSHHAHELSFGMLRADRSARPVAAALRDALGAPLPKLTEAGLLIPSTFYQRQPMSPGAGALTHQALRNAYAALEKLGYLPQVVLESDLTNGRELPELLVAPSVQRLRAPAPTWAALADYRGRLIYSYLHGVEVRSHEGAWIGAVEAKVFFGGEPHNHFNLAENRPEALVWPSGQLSLPGGPNPFAETPLILAPKEATVIGRDLLDRPLWLRLSRRDMLLYPLEALATDPALVASFYQAVLDSVRAE